MSGSSLFIDTIIDLYLLGKDDTIAGLLDKKDVYISFITELELLGFKNLIPEEISKIQSLINDCVVIDINQEIKQHVISLRSNYPIKLPDSIIASTALYLGLPLLTADKTFTKLNELTLLFYEVND